MRGSAFRRREDRAFDETLDPGEIISSGTVGNGRGLERFRFLKDGDAVELEFEGVGVLRNSAPGCPKMAGRL